MKKSALKKTASKPNSQDANSRNISDLDKDNSAISSQKVMETKDENSLSKLMNGIKTVQDEEEDHRFSPDPDPIHRDVMEQNRSVDCK